MRYAITLDHRLITDGYKERVTKQKSMHTLNHHPEVGYYIILTQLYGLYCRKPNISKNRFS